MYTALQIAIYMIEKYGEIVGDLTNLKLQKLLYFAQGLCMRHTCAPLFNEEIWAWRYGPVVPEVYRHFNRCVAEPITLEDTDKREAQKLLNELRGGKIESILEETFVVYGNRSAQELVRLSHEQDPWKDTMKNQGIDSVIPKAAIKTFFCNMA